METCTGTSARGYAIDWATTLGHVARVAHSLHAYGGTINQSRVRGIVHTRDGRLCLDVPALGLLGVCLALLLFLPFGRLPWRLRCGEANISCACRPHTPAAPARHTRGGLEWHGAGAAPAG